MANKQINEFVAKAALESTDSLVLQDSLGEVLKASPSTLQSDWNATEGLKVILNKPTSLSDIKNWVLAGTSFEETGFVVRTSSARAYDDVYPSSISTAATGLNAAAFTAYSGNMRALEFVGSGNALKEAIATFQIYHSYDEGTPVTPHIHLYVPDDATGGDITFYMEYHWDNVGSTGAITTQTVSGTVVRGASAGVGKNVVLSFGDIVGTGMKISSILTARIYRDPTSALDTFGSSVWLRSADVHILKSTEGSRTPFSK